MSSAERAGRVQCLRTLLLGVLPVFTSYLLSHNGIDDFDPFRSFAAAFQSDLEQVLGVVRRHESTALLDGVDVLERIMGMLERFIDDEIPDQIGSTINDADYSVSTVASSELEGRMQAYSSVARTTRTILSTYDSSFHTCTTASRRGHELVRRSPGLPHKRKEASEKEGIV